MPFSQGSRTGLAYVVETTYGVTPVTPSMINLPYNSHSLSLKKDSLESAEIRPDRQTKIVRHGNKQVNGDLEVDFRADDFDDLLESAFFNDFTTGGVLKIGTTLKSLTIEERALDITQYRQFSGIVINTMNLTVVPNEIVKCRFGLVGKNSLNAQVPLDAAITDSGDNDPFDAFSGTIFEGGLAIANVSSIELNIDNGVAPTFVIGSDVTPQLEYGRAKVSGTIQAYFENLTLMNKFLNETESTLEFSLDDPISGNAYTFLLPRIKYMGGDLPVQNEQSKMLSLPFVGLLSDSDGTNLSITKG